MTILIAFHSSQGYRNFKGYYTHFVLQYLRREFPQAVSYSRFVTLLSHASLPLCAYLSSRTGQVRGISFVDSTKLQVCHNRRIDAHKVFKGMAQRGKTSMGWFYGLKLHLILNDRGELVAVEITPGNPADRRPVPRMAKNRWGQLFGDRGYISQKLLPILCAPGVELITKVKKT